MSDANLQMTGQVALDEQLTRLSKKPGVKATIALDRSTGAILRTSGQLSSIDSATTLAGQSSGEAGSASSQPQSQPQSQSQNGETGNQLEMFAAKVWAWVNASGGLVEELDSEDELKLLRLRTKKQELVIVPDVKYLLIVVHDTPPA